MQVIDLVKTGEVFEMTGETISVWFYNMEPPEMGLEEAREYTEELVTDLLEKIRSGEMTMEEAGDVIRNDSVMKEIDIGLEGNAYSLFSIIGDSQTFTDPELQKDVRSLEEDELSEVLVGRDKSEDWYDAFFMVVKVDEKQEGFESYDDWVSNARGRIEVVVFK